MSHNLSFYRYLQLNKSTLKWALRLCILIFSGIASIMALIFGKGDMEITSFELFILCELYGLGLGLFTMAVALWEGFAKARTMIRRFYGIPNRVREANQLELRQTSHNPKYYFMRFEIVTAKEGVLIPLDLNQLKALQLGKTSH